MRIFLISNRITVKHLVFLFAVLMVYFLNGTSMGTAHADEPPIESDNVENGMFKSNVHLWVPSKMIKGETYEGLVVLSDAATGGDLILITSSDKTMIESPKSITILPESNHGIFEIKTLKEGDARIFASVNGEVSSVDVKVYSSNITPDKLGIFLPSNSTKTAKVPAYVFTLDRNGSPAPVIHDTMINLGSSSDMIKIPSSVTIQNQTYYAQFTAEVNGAGKITASAANLKPDTIHVTRQQENVDVMMAVAPNIALENSQVYYYVWLQKDGKPFKPPYVIDVFLSSNDPQVARLAPRSTTQHYGDGTIRVTMADGIARGTMFTGERGSASISANVDGFGYAQADLVVGPATFSNENLTNDIQGGPSSDISDVNSIISSRIDAMYQPNIVLTWVFPSKTTGKAYGVAALYWQNVTKSVSTNIDEINGTAVQSTISTQMLIPLHLDDRTITVASQKGLVHKTIYQMSQSNRLESAEGKGRLSAIEFELDASNQGDYAISVSGAGLGTSQTRLQVVPEYAESYKIDIVLLPSRPQVRQDLAMVSILDGDGNLVDSGIAKKDIEIITSKIRASETRTVSWNGASTIVRGELLEQAGIVAFVKNMGAISADITPAGISTAIEFDLPQLIHVGEYAPYVIHEVDAFGTPLARIKPIGMSTSGGIEIDRNKQHLIAKNNGQGKVAVLADVGADTKNFEAFSNTMNVQIVLDKEKARVGEQIQIIVISDVPNPGIAIDSSVPFTRSKEHGDSKSIYFFAYPDRERIFDVVVTAQKDGFTPVTKSLSFEAVNLYDIIVKAVSTQDGKEIPAKHTIIISNQTINRITPYNKELGPSLITASFPPEQKTGDKIYSLKKIQIGNEESFNESEIEFFLNDNTEITAYYDRMIKVDVAGAKGSGFYPYGQTVTLSVPPKDKMSFFVREVFDHWNGLPYETEPVSFTASEDISASVAYRDDYTFLMLVVATIVTSTLYATTIRNKVNLRWEISKLVDLLRNSIKVNLPKTSHIKESLEGKKKRFSWQLKRKEESEYD
jgi:hypothetical protein